MFAIEVTDYEIVCGFPRQVTAADRAYRTGLAQGRHQARCEPPVFSMGQEHLYDAFVQGHEAGRWEVEGSFIQG